MTTKICNKCGIEKDISDFNTRKLNGKILYRGTCKECQSKYYRKKYKELKENNPEKYNEIREKQKEYHKTYINPNEKEKSKEYYQKNREKIINRTSENRKKRRQANPELEKEKLKAYREKNKETLAKYNKEYYSNPDVKKRRNETSKRSKLKNKDKPKRILTEEEKLHRRIVARHWWNKNKKRLNERRRLRDLERCRKDPVYKLHYNFSSLLRWHLKAKKFYKCSTSENILGYTIKELKAHLESQFEPWMNWSNQGKTSTEPCKTWQIDHIRPVNTFNITSIDCEDFKKCWALENLRPLDSYYNVRRPKNGEDILLETKEEKDNLSSK